MAKTPDDRQSREAEARRAGIRIVVRDGVRVDGPNPADNPAESTSPTPDVVPRSTRYDRDPQRDAINEAIRRFKQLYPPDGPPPSTSDEELRRRQRQHLARVQARRSGGGTREVDCLHNQCPLCWGTGIKANGEPCVHTIACECPRCRPLKFTMLATTSAG